MTGRLAIVALCVSACGGDTGPPVTDDAPGPVADASGSGDAAAPAHVVAYVSGYGPDLAWFDVDPATAALAPVASLASALPAPSYLAMTSTHLYAASEGASRISAYAIDPQTGGLTLVDDQPSGGSGPAHVTVDRAGKYVLVANYGDGMIAVLPIRADGGLAPATQTLDAGANAHEVVVDPSNTHVLVPCKGSDYVAQYAFDPATGTLTANAVPRLATAAGAGPRHLAFAPDGAHAYLVNELDSTLTALAYDGATGRLSALQTVSTRAAGATGANTGAEVVVHASGTWVYASNRGDDDLATFAIAPATGRLTLVGHTPTGGATPRAFAIDPTGTWLFAANQGSNTVTRFRIDAATGALTPALGGGADNVAATAMQPSFVGFVSLP